jgi:uncharacterized membrane protein YeiH
MAGTLVFAVEGALAGRGHLDLLGVMVLAFATALGGGIVRDVLIGDIPPAALKSWLYAAVAFTGGAIYFFLHALVDNIPPNLLMVLVPPDWHSSPLRARRRRSSSRCILSSRF